MLVIAEIADKMPTIGDTFCWATVLALVAGGWAAFRPWLVFLPLPMIVFYDWSMLAELAEPQFGEAIIRELGWGWVVGRFVAWNGPFLAVLNIMALAARSRRRFAREICSAPA